MHWASGIPCALYSQRGETFLAKLGQIVPRDRGPVSGIHVIANRHCERSEAIHSQSNGDNGLLRRVAPRNDGPQSDTGRKDDLNTRHTHSRHRPRMRAIQYSRDARDQIKKLRRIGTSGQAGR